jgi:hypothetical protein
MKLLIRSAALGILFLSTTSLCMGTPGSNATEEQTWDYVRVLGISSDQLSIDVEVAPFNDCKIATDSSPQKACQQLHLTVKDTVVKDRMKQLQRGDRIKITFAPAEHNQNVLKEFCLDEAPPVSKTTRILVLVVSAAICFVLAYFWSRRKPLELLVGEDNRYSNSKFQIAAWFFVLVTTYVSTVWLRIWFAGCDFIGGVNIPQNLLLISGMSVLTFGGAKAITTSKVEAEKTKTNGDKDPKEATGTKPSFLTDLTHNDGKPSLNIPRRLDLGDFQMVAITLVAVATYLVLLFNFLGTIETAKTISLPDVDTTILAIFGLGHGAYLTKKAVGNVAES